MQAMLQPDDPVSPLCCMPGLRAHLQPGNQIHPAGELVAATTGPGGGLMALIVHRSSFILPRMRTIIRAGDGHSFESRMPSERERRSCWRDYSQPAALIPEDE